jgi:hypothetical protein
MLSRLEDMEAQDFATLDNPSTFVQNQNLHLVPFSQTIIVVASASLFIPGILIGHA